MHSNFFHHCESGITEATLTYNFFMSSEVIVTIFLITLAVTEIVSEQLLRSCQSTLDHLIFLINCLKGQNCQKKLTMM